MHEKAVARPADRDLLVVLRYVGRLLDADCAYQSGGTFFFPLTDEWALSVSPDSAGRFRLGAFYGATEVATMWSFKEDWDRLADLILALQAEARELAGAG